ncbi:chemotaxis response regulator protein-glutamate methylesterase [Chryseolinea sp. T2]|uniref:protein-glutamate methylesterase/protein-glutamine glutaminase n=1 Tax=Chryseolinea sp. T2 TaxID=3129255 RepID=UPI0030777B67
MAKIKVLIVDDSAVVRQTLSSILQADSDIEVMSTASDPFVAAQKLSKEVPDVITLDVEMPRMDGLTFLRKIMSQHPIPVVIISSLTAKGTETAVQALEIGAVDVIEKSSLNADSLQETERNIIQVVKGAAQAIVRRKSISSNKVESMTPTTRSMLKTTEQVIAVGASTGATEAVLNLLQSMPIDCPGIVVVQHMPEMFTRSFAERLNTVCKVTVKEARHGDSILRGHALIAPGNKHMEVRRSGARYYVSIREGDPVNRHRPSVDVLFDSVARDVGRNAIGVLLTGMGADGARGMLEMKNTGAKTIAQDESTSVVFGMPKEAIRLNAADKVLPLNKIGAYILANCI